MTPFLFISKVFLLGLSIAQVLSVIQVYFSNTDYYKVLTSIQVAGYLAVPNSYVYSTLNNFGPVFYGGLFFTFTVGAALTVISSGLAWAWDRLFSRNRIILYLLSLLLLLCLIFANIRGFSPLITGYLLFVPFPVFLFTLKCLPEHKRQKNYYDIIYPAVSFLVIILIFIAWKPFQLNSERFLDIRDTLLLSNSIGRKVNDFYYENSLYATRLFNSSRHELIRTCSLEMTSEPALFKKLTKSLLSQDYLPLDKAPRTDVRITLSNSNLAFYSDNKLILNSSINDFFHNPEAILNQYEKRTDPQPFLLHVTLFSLLFIIALFLCFCIYTPFYLISGLFLISTPRSVKAGILWPVALFIFFLVFNGNDTGDLKERKNLERAISSDHLQARITGLKYLVRNRVDISGLPGWQIMTKSRYITERYWLAKAMGASRTLETRERLYQLLDDPHFNVACMALESLGRRGNRDDIPPILTKIEGSDNWYEQWYAYRALRRLGWRQGVP